MLNTWRWTVLAVLVLLRPSAALAEPKIPTSARAQEAIAEVRPALEKSLAELGLGWGAAVYIQIFKQEKKLALWVKKGEQFVLFRSYAICTYGGGSLGPKLQQGDGQAPEGIYRVYPRQLNPMSSYHLAFNVGYPNSLDRALGRSGGLIMVHGDCVSIGCFAMTHAKIQEIYALVDAALGAGQKYVPVHIFPFAMTTQNMAAHRGSPWFSFWSDLQQIAARFEQTHTAPQVEIRDKRYVLKSTSVINPK